MEVNTGTSKTPRKRIFQIPKLFTQQKESVVGVKQNDVYTCIFTVSHTFRPKKPTVTLLSRCSSVNKTWNISWQAQNQKKKEEEN